MLSPSQQSACAWYFVAFSLVGRRGKEGMGNAAHMFPYGFISRHACRANPFMSIAYEQISGGTLTGEKREQAFQRGRKLTPVPCHSIAL